ncbi:MAG TPA: hypothetical protein VMM12_11985 [Longimicrobiales bacterium]|nr:hypothetical protein [Longimicrobiales bacterium]
MPRLPLVAALAAALSAPFAAPAVAQQSEDAFALGLGLRSTPIIFDDDFLTSFAPRVYFAFPAGGRIILEPSFGLFRVSRKAESDAGSSSFSASAVNLAVALLFASDAGSDGRLYWGPRVGVVRSAFESEFSGGPRNSSQRLDLQLAAVTGGEFFLVPRLGLGGEVGLEWTRTGDDDGPADESGSILGTTAELRLRWYLR